MSQTVHDTELKQLQLVAAWNQETKQLKLPHVTSSTKSTQVKSIIILLCVLVRISKFPDLVARPIQA